MLKKLRYQIFLIVYYKIIRKRGKLVDLKNKGLIEGRSANIIFNQIKLAKFLGIKFKKVLAGDSNSEVFSNYKTVKSLDEPTFTMGIGSATAFEWNDWFESLEGQKFLREFSEVTDEVCDWIWNIGGNHALQKRMKGALEALRRLHSRFPKSFNIIIPALHYSLLEPVFDDKDSTLKTSVTKINNMIKEVWGSRTIDLSPIFGESNSEAKLGTLGDMVHYSKLSVKFISKFINAIT